MMKQMKSRKGIILAGGTGTRLHPMTISVSKQLMPLYDKPMIYYPLSTLMLSGIKEILIITTPADIEAFKRLLGDGSQWGLKLSFATQDAPRGLPEAFTIGQKWLDGAPSCLVLGDNIFYGKGLGTELRTISSSDNASTIFAYQVKDPERYGVVEMGENGRVLSIEEKPKAPRSKLAITGLYFFDEKAPEFAQNLKPSPRGETEIIELIRCYLNLGSLSVHDLGRGTAWLDTGTPESLLQAANFVEVIEQRQGLKIACPEEIAWRLGYIDRARLTELAQKFKGNAYGKYLEGLLS
jgi:glucose-1-phosphate thymidylyltransferase